MIFWIIFISKLFAGSSGSGGGGIIQHEQNPWFLENDVNLKKVSYCIQVADDFELTSDDLDALIKGAIGFWNQEFTSAHYPVIAINDKKKTSIYVKTQNFVRQNCSLQNAGNPKTQETDVVFQFGVLGTEQREEFKKQAVDLTSYVALTHMIDYDFQKLKAKGIVYVSPDKGPDKFVGQDVADKAWEGEKGINRLGNILRHETGHIFGLSHQGSRYELMGAQFPEYVVSSQSAFGYIVSSNNIFYPKAGDKINNGIFVDPPSIDPTFRQFFGIQPEHKIARISYRPEGIIVQSRIANDLPWEKVGAADFPDADQIRLTNKISLWIPKEQTIFPQLASFINVYSGAQAVEIQNSGTFINQEKNIQRPVFVQVSAARFQIGGVVDGKMIPNLALDFGTSDWKNSNKMNLKGEK